MNKRMNLRCHHIEASNQTADLILAFHRLDQIELAVLYFGHVAQQPLNAVIIRTENNDD
ncbi:hypothetical protein D3C84_1309800 [compost metagenome]